MNLPLVTVSIPVRNGNHSLEAALRSITDQDYQNLEILISDNNSNDETGKIIGKFMKKDRRIICYRQDETITAIDNFKFLLEKAKGEYFMWAAHDDTRSSNYISKLIEGLKKNHDTVMCFGDLYITDGKAGQAEKTEFNFDSGALGKYRRVWKTLHLKCYHLYGLWRTSELKRIPLIFSPWWPDLPLMMAASFRGHFRYVPGAGFTYREIPKTKLERALYQDNQDTTNRISRAIRLFVVTFKTILPVEGVIGASLGTVFIILRQIEKTPGYILKKIMSG